MNESRSNLLIPIQYVRNQYDLRWCDFWAGKLMKPYRRVLPALAEGESPDKGPQTAVEADRGGHTEDGYDPNGWTERKQQADRRSVHMITWYPLICYKEIQFEYVNGGTSFTTLRPVLSVLSEWTTADGRRSAVCQQLSVLSGEWSQHSRSSQIQICKLHLQPHNAGHWAALWEEMRIKSVLLLKQLGGSLHWSYMEESLSNFVVQRLLKWSGLFLQLSSESTPCCKPFWHIMWGSDDTRKRIVFHTRKA